MLGKFADTLGIPVARAHEAYVLTPQEMKDAWNLPVRPYLSTSSTFLAALLSAAAAALFLLYIEKRWGNKISAGLENISWGYQAMRIAAGAVLITSGLTGKFLGTEMGLPGSSPLVALACILAGISLILNIFPKAGAALGTALFVASVPEYGWHLLNYAYYPGIFAAIWLGSRRIRGLPDALRFLYGGSLLYAAFGTKLLHPGVPLAVVNKFSLAEYAVFPGDPLLIVLGATLAEVAIALLIMAGAGLRPMLLFSLAVATLALIYLPEAPWPHLALYGISAYLFFSPQEYSLDHLVRSSKKPA